MRDGVNTFDKVIFICSKNSLQRPGVINELEETLQREAREGGNEILIPISIDDYVFNHWNPNKKGLKQSILDRVIGDFRGTVISKKKFSLACNKLILALGGDLDFRYTSFHSTLLLDEKGQYCKIVMQRKFIVYKPIDRIIYTGLNCSGTILPLNCSFGTISMEAIGGNHTANILLDEELPLNQEITHRLEIAHLDSYMAENESYCFTGLSDCPLSTLEIHFPSGRPLKKASFVCLFKNKSIDLEDSMKVNELNRHLYVSVQNPVRGANYLINWSW